MEEVSKEAVKARGVKMKVQSIFITKKIIKKIDHKFQIRLVRCHRQIITELAVLIQTLEALFLEGVNIIFTIIILVKLHKIFIRFKHHNLLHRLETK